jgi:hypothetical protein
MPAAATLMDARENARAVECPVPVRGKDRILIRAVPGVAGKVVMILFGLGSGWTDLTFRRGV